jgi:hypothetical protein
MEIALEPEEIAGRGESADERAVQRTSLDYVESWYTGDAAAMQRAVHPELAKRFVRGFQSGTQFLEEVGASKLVAWTASGGGVSVPAEDRRDTVTVLDCYFRAAMSKVVIASGVEYLQLGKFGTHWKVINVLAEARMCSPFAMPLYTASSSQASPELQEERVVDPAWEAAARNYAEGWNLAEESQVASMVHPQWSKKSVQMTESGDFFLESWGAEKMARWVGSPEHGAERQDKSVERIEIFTLDHHDGIAAVKVAWDFDVRGERPGSVDYLSLAQFGNSWRAVNIMWEGVRSSGDRLVGGADRTGWLL